MTDKLFIALLNAYGAHSKISRNSFQKLGLSSGQPKILYVLKRNEGKLQKEIAELCSIEQSTMTVLIKKMEAQGWVRRETATVSGGKRAYFLFLTDSGRKVAQEIDYIVDLLEEKAFRYFSQTEKASLLEYLRRVERNLSQPYAPFRSDGMYYSSKEISIFHHERRLVGTLYLPETENPVPLVIFSHGYNGIGEDFTQNSRFLAERGIGSLCLDFCGGSVKSRSDGKTTDMTIFSEKEDLLAAFQEAASLKQIRKDAIFLFGGSQGGLVSALAAEELQDSIRGLILLFPALCIADNWNDRFHSAEEIPDTFEFWGMVLGKRFFETLLGFHTFEHIGSFQKKVLILHGDQDKVVNLSYSQKAAGLYPNAKLVVFPGEGHGFSPEGDSKMSQMVYDFVTNCLKENDI